MKSSEWSNSQKIRTRENMSPDPFYQIRNNFTKNIYKTTVSQMQKLCSK